MNKILTNLKLQVTIPLLLTVLFPSLTLADAKTAIQCGVNGAAGASDCTVQPTTSLTQTITTIVTILSIVAGLTAVIMIIIAGIRYTTSGGSQEATKEAKNTLLYAIVGLVIAALAQLVVHFVLHSLS